MMLSELWSDLRYRMRRIVRRGEVEREIDDEVRFHLEREAEKRRTAGASADQAMREARLAFGGIERVKDDTREAHGTLLVEQIMRDVIYAWRGFHARPLFTAVVVATIGLGVGVNAAMFGILDRALFRPPAYLVDAARVHRIFVTWTGTTGRRSYRQGMEYARYADFARWSRSMDRVAGFANRELPVGEGENLRERTVSIATSELFDFFDAKPILGRFFTQLEDTPPRGEDVAVLSFEYWHSELAASRAVLGTTIKIGRRTYTVIGVAPRGFNGMADVQMPIAFIPMAPYGSTVSAGYDKNYNWSWLSILVHRKPGTSIEAANADLTSAFRLSWNTERALDHTLASPDVVHPEAIAAPLLLARGPNAGPETRVLKWISGVALIVLLIACANVASLLLSRALYRRREIAVRRALGGSRARLVQQLLTETTVLALLGTAAGLLGAQAAATAMRRLFVDSRGGTAVVSDGRTILFAFALTAVAALCAGLLPALSVGRDALGASLRAGPREGGYRKSRARSTLLVFQTALSVMLLVGAGLFVRSLQAVRSIQLGYDVAPMVVVEASDRGSTLSTAEIATLGDALVAEARRIPGVENATLAVSVPFQSSEGHGLSVAGIDSVRRLGFFLLQAGSPEYFATTGTHILRGRAFTTDDRAGTPRVAVVSDAMAKVLWKQSDAIGKCFHIGPLTEPCITVIGVAENMRASGLTGDPEFAYYLPIAQYRANLEAGPPALFVRVHGRSDDFAETIRARLQGIMPGASYVMTLPFHEIVDPTMRSWSSGATMFLAFGVLALVLAAIGLYAVVAFSVAQRTQELGVRIALGARSRDLLRLVVGEGVRVTIGGVIIGAAIALIAGRGMAPLLFHVSPRDPTTYTIVAAVLILVGILASTVPAMRATRVDPNVALRTD